MSSPSPAQQAAQKTMMDAINHQTMVHTQTNDPKKHAEEAAKVSVATQAYVKANQAGK